MSIRLLPPLLANQIAAGEVVDRPASILKELIENSLDAGATKIQICLQNGGIQSIEVIDNGSGIPSEELSLALLRHATSKLRRWSDLLNLGTFGFRGEALASICAVARVKLISRIPGADVAWMVQTEGTTHPDLKPELAPFTPPPGTTIVVNDLFYNLPVRRRYLRSARTEWLRCMELVRAMALVHPQVHWRLLHNDRLQLDLAAFQETGKAGVERRLADVWGAAWLKGAHFGYQSFQGYEFKAWLGTRMGLKRGVGACQFQYLNGRMVRDPIIQRAVRQAFLEVQASTLPLFTVQCLQIEAPKEQVDINVHPQKEQVRFQQVRWIHGLVYRGIASILNQARSQSGEAAIVSSEVEERTATIPDLSSAQEEESGITPEERAERQSILHTDQEPFELTRSTVGWPGKEQAIEPIVEGISSASAMDTGIDRFPALYNRASTPEKVVTTSFLAPSVVHTKDRIVGIYSGKFGLLETKEPRLFMFALADLQEALWRLRLEAFQRKGKRRLLTNPIAVSSATSTNRDRYRALFELLVKFKIEIALSSDQLHYFLYAVPEDLNPHFLTKALPPLLVAWVEEMTLTPSSILDRLAAALRSADGPLEHVSAVVRCMREIESFEEAYFANALPTYFRRIEVPFKDV